MLSPQVLSEIGRLGSVLWSGGALRPLTALEQVTYLLFLKRLEALDKIYVTVGGRTVFGPRHRCELNHHGVHPSTGDGEKPCPGHETCRWSRLSEIPASSLAFVLRDEVFPWLRELPATLQQMNVPAGHPLTRGTALMSDASFQLATEKTETLSGLMKSLDELFPSFTPDGTGAPGTGEVYEHLVRECTGARSGTIRTPRHLARFMAALLEPGPDARICDPAAGTGELLVAALQNQRMREAEGRSQPVLLAWDGTPEIVPLPGASTPVWDEVPAELVGFEPDRALVRIGWMNLVLHGLPHPRVALRDTLSTSDDDGGRYDAILCFPGFGRIREDVELSPRLASYPGSSGKERAALVTWRVLDLLRPEGRAAVVLPEGVLFSQLHGPLRRELVATHVVEGVVSLPKPVFQPDIGIPTAVVVFRRAASPSSKPPHERSVWFYEVEADGFSPDSRRAPRPSPNDFWDALQKWPHRPDRPHDYVQPELVEQRWRTVDARLRANFAERDFPPAGTALPVHLLFPELADGDELVTAAQVEDRVRSQGLEALSRLIGIARLEAGPTFSLDPLIRRIVYEGNRILFPGPDGFGRRALLEVLQQATQRTAGEIMALTGPEPSLGPDAPDERIGLVVRGFARIDGFNLTVRSRAVRPVAEKLAAAKCWCVPVRRFAVVPDWASPDGKVRGSHDPAGNPRPEFVADRRIYHPSDPERVRPEYLDPGCLEASDYSLSAARYRPREDEPAQHAPPAELIRRIRDAELQLVAGLDGLLAMLEERA